MTDLKEVLMNLGNKLVLEKRYKPATDSILSQNSTHIIRNFAVWINERPDVQDVLKELGFDWSMPKKGF